MTSPRLRTAMPTLSPFVIRCATAVLGLGLSAALMPQIADAAPPAQRQPARAAATARTAPTTGAEPAAQPVAGVGAPSAAARAFEAVIEPLRQTVVAAQVSGAIVELTVQAGDAVRAGQLLARIDARAADQAQLASQAQLVAARSQLDLAQRELARQQALFARHYISQAALDQAQAQVRAAQAQVDAQQAATSATRTQTGWHLVRAPYAGVVSEVPVALGDMAMPGRPLLTLYEPGRLRVSAALPHSVAATLPANATLRVELPGAAAGAGAGTGASQWLAVRRWQRLPQADAATHTLTVRAELDSRGALPGQLLPGGFARLWLPAAGHTTLDDAGATPGGTSGGTSGSTSGNASSGAAGAASAGAAAGPAAAGSAAAGQSPVYTVTAGSLPPRVPAAAIVRRAELTGLYVLDADGRPLLRQVRLGRAVGDWVPVLAGLRAGERVHLQPQQAARASQGADAGAPAGAAAGGR